MNVRNRPPRLIRFLSSLLVPRSEREFFLGDLNEMFDGARNPANNRRSLVRETVGIVPLVLESLRSAWRHRPKSRDSVALEFARDVRYGVRMMVRSPGFTIVAIVTLALGIGANTAIFSVADAVLFEPLPFREPQRLMRPSLVIPEGTHGLTTHRENVWSVPKYDVFNEVQQSFSATAAYYWRGVTLTGETQPERITAEVVESSYLDVLGISPLLGTGFTPGDDLPGQSRNVILSHEIWSRRWGRDPAVVGSTMRTSGDTYTVIGVLPEGFKGLSGRAEILLPFAVVGEATRADIWSHFFFVVARLKDGVTASQARLRMTAVGRRIDEAFPSTDVSLQGWGATARTLNDLRADSALETSIYLLLGAVAFVLLIACANIANMLLARASGRSREMSIRAAVGASRSRLVRQLLAEGLVLAIGGAAVGLGLAYLGVEALRSLGPAARGVLQGDVKSLTTLGLDRIAVDGSTLLAALVLAVSTAVLIAIVPALKSSSQDLTKALKQGCGWQAGKPGAGYLGGRGILVVAEFTLAFVLLAGSGLMLRSFLRLHEVDLGFRPEGVLTGHVILSSGDYARPERETFFAELRDRIGALPGVTSVGVGDCPPVSGGCSSTVIRFFDRPPVDDGAEPPIDIHMVTPGFFETLGVRLIRGRTFDSRDRYGARLVTVLSQSAADQFWPGDDPVGETVGLGQAGFWGGAEIVGIVGDVPFDAIEAAPKPTAYVPHGQAGFTRGYLFVRADGDPATLAADMRRTVAAMDSNLPLTDVRSMDERVDAAAVRTRFSANLLSLFAAVALVLSAVGIFGVLSYLVAQQTREIGIRMALGARRTLVFRQVLQRAFVLTLLGVVIGGGAALGLLRFMSSLLFEVRYDDPATLAGVAMILSVVSVSAAWVPAWKATRVDPLQAIRE